MRIVRKKINKNELINFAFDTVSGMEEFGLRANYSINNKEKFIHFRYKVKLSDSWAKDFFSKREKIIEIFNIKFAKTGWKIIIDK